MSGAFAATESVCLVRQDEIIPSSSVSIQLMEKRMAEVIRLDTWLAKQPKRMRDQTGEARILLFTGVRYERWTDADDHPRKRRSGSKSKKH